MSDEFVAAQQQTTHTPVLLAEVLHYLQADQGGAFLDCTLGGGGHTKALLDANPNTSVLACDRDGRALERAKSSLKNYSSRLQIQQSPFSGLLAVAPAQGFDGLLADLGISSDQLAEGRGFSFQDDTPLDMRMDENSSYSAAMVVNETTPPELFKILKRGGVGREAHSVVAAICQHRPFQTTHQLAEAVAAVVGGRDYHKKVHPATVVFQALRIEVNQELVEIEALLQAAPVLLRRPGRLAVISFHSLEDKLVASTLRQWEQGEQRPALWPGAEGRGAGTAPLGRLLTRKAITATSAEVQQNPRARSARLRVFEFAATGGNS